MTKLKAKRQKKEKKEKTSEQPTFEELVNNVLEQLRETTLNSYVRKNTGAFKFKAAGLKVMATELLDQAVEFQGFFSAASFSLAAALFAVGAYELQEKKITHKTKKTKKTEEKIE